MEPRKKLMRGCLTGLWVLFDFTCIRWSLDEEIFEVSETIKAQGVNFGFATSY